MGNKQLDELEEWLTQHDFNELTADEKAVVIEEMGDEETYNRLRQMHSQVVKEKFSPSRNTKSKLMTTMRKQNQSFFYRVINFKIPAITAAVALMLIMTLTWMIRPLEKVVVEKPIFVKGEVVIDTLVIRELDTVYLEKPVYRTVFVQNDKQKPTFDQKIVQKNKSLAQQTDLREILVKSD